MRYEYLCPEGHVSERTFTVIEREEFIDCDYCMNKGKRIISRSSFKLKGDGWAKDGYSKGE